MRALSGVVVLLVALGCTEGDVMVQSDTRDPEQLYELCVMCHGEDLQGNRFVNAPAIAGLAGWYVEAQLFKFKEGHRGTHFDDQPGMQMRPMAMSLTDADIILISEMVADRPVVEPPPEIEGGDPARGKLAYAPCTACHGNGRTGAGSGPV